MLTPAIYRTTVTHNRQAPVHHSFEYRSYSWYIDIDELPLLPWWLRPFARFDARDHFAGRPGGLIPSAKAVLDITERDTALRAVDMLSLQEHYAETLRLWRERLMQRRKMLAHIGFDEVFARMWELYLAHAEAGFRSGYLNVYQWTFVNEAAP